MTVSEIADAPDSQVRFLHGWGAVVLVIASLVGAAALYGVMDLASGGYLSRPHGQGWYRVIALALVLGVYPMLRITRSTLQELRQGASDWGGLVRAAAVNSVACTMLFAAFSLGTGL